MKQGLRTVSMAMLACSVSVSASAFAGGATPLKVSPDVGNSTFSAVFDAKVGERITAVSSQVACDVTLDTAAGTVSGHCKVPLKSIMVDNEPTKTEHFEQWSTNKKMEPDKCSYDAEFKDVKLSAPLKNGESSTFTTEVPFTVCGRKRTDGGSEKVTGTVTQLAPSGQATKPSLKVRAKVEGFNREKYQIGPKWTEGWLSRVQQLAPVVSAEGTIELSLFAKFN